MDKSTFKKHKISLLSIFILGNTVIVFPKGVGVENAVISVILTVIPTAFISYFIFKSSDILNKLPSLFNMLIIIFTFYVFVITARDYVSFVDTVRLPKTPRFFISIVFILLSVFLGNAKQKVLYLFSLFSIIISAIIFAIVFLVSIEKLNLNNLIFNSFDFKKLLRQTLTFFIHSFGQILIPVLFFKSFNINDNKRIVKWGLMSSFLLMLIYVLNIILVLGNQVTSSVAYPYATLTSFISFGRNFSRLDGFTYYVYFFSSIIKTSVCAAVIFNFFDKKKRTAVIIITAVLLIICNLNFVQKFLHTDIVNLVVLIFEIIYPISIYFYQKLKCHRK